MSAGLLIQLCIFFVKHLHLHCTTHTSRYNRLEVINKYFEIDSQYTHTSRYNPPYSYNRCACGCTRSIPIQADIICKNVQIILNTWIEYVLFKPYRVYLMLNKFRLTYTFSVYGRRAARN